MRCNSAQVKAFYFCECMLGEETVWMGLGAVQSLVFLAEYDPKSYDPPRCVLSSFLNGLKKFVVYIPDWQLLHICPHLT